MKRFNPWRQFHGAYVPEWLMRAPGISPGAKLTYARLCRYAGKNGVANPRLEELAEEIAVSKRSVQNYLAELETACLIEAEQVGLNQPNRYYFLWSSMIDGEDSEVADLATPGWQTSATQDRQDPATPSSPRESSSESSSHAVRRDVSKRERPAPRKRWQQDDGEDLAATGRLDDDGEQAPAPVIPFRKPKRGWTATTLVEYFARRALDCLEVQPPARDTNKGALGKTIKKWLAEGTATPDSVAAAMDTLFSVAPATRLQGEATLWLAFVNHYSTIAQQRVSDHKQEPSVKHSLAAWAASK